MTCSRSHSTSEINVPSFLTCQAWRSGAGLSGPPWIQSEWEKGPRNSWEKSRAAAFPQKCSVLPHRYTFVPLCLESSPDVFHLPPCAWLNSFTLQVALSPGSPPTPEAEFSALRDALYVPLSTRITQNCHAWALVCTLRDCKSTKGKS